jgi:hypothetical protein
VAEDTPEGWYPDPGHAGYERRWLGKHWSQTRQVGTIAPPPATEAGPAPPGAATEAGPALTAGTPAQATSADMLSRAPRGWILRMLIFAVGALVIAFVVAAIVGHLANDNSSAVSVPPVNVTTPSIFGVSKALPSTVIGKPVLIAGFGGDRARVIVVKLIDPSTPANALMGADAGSRLVAVEVHILNAGTTTLDDDALSDLSIAGSNRDTYTPGFASAAGCPDFDDGAFTLDKGASATGCVEFQLPDGVAVERVTFTLESGEGPQTGVWSRAGE